MVIALPDFSAMTSQARHAYLLMTWQVDDMAGRRSDAYARSWTG
jgi:hypothetical protein